MKPYSKSVLDDLVTAAKGVLAHIDRINPPDGPYWSGAIDQEALRAALAKISQEVERA